MSRLALAATLGLTAVAIFWPPKPPAPINPAPTPVPGNPGAPKFRKLVASEGMVFPVGTTWLVEADVPWFASGLVTEEAIRKKADELGLLVLRASKTRPSYWPVLSNADWYVLLVNSDKDKRIDPPSGVQGWEVV